MLTYRRVSRQLYRIRDKKYPKRPSTDEELKSALEDNGIFEQYGKTLDHLRPVYAGSVIEKDEYAFHVFASFGIVDLVKANIPPDQRRYLVDGTFKIIPRQFRQLLILAIEYKNDVSLLSYRNPFMNEHCSRTIYPYRKHYHWMSLSFDISAWIIFFVDRYSRLHMFWWRAKLLSAMRQFSTILKNTSWSLSQVISWLISKSHYAMQSEIVIHLLSLKAAGTITVPLYGKKWCNLACISFSRTTKMRGL